MKKKTNKKLNIEAILQDNPHIDKKSFVEIRKTLQRRKTTSERAKYNLLSPFESRIFLK